METVRIVLTGISAHVAGVNVMIKDKDKKRKGHKEAKLLIPHKEAKRLNLEPTTYWDDWADHRDSHRDLSDRSRIRPVHVNEWAMVNYNIKEDNKKLKRMEKIRRVRNG